METEGWIRQLGRLYKEVSEADDGDGGNRYAEQFNRILSQLQQEFPENEFIQNTSAVDKVARRSGKRNANREILLKCGQLADVLGFDLPEMESGYPEGMTLITVNSEQEQNVTQSQEVSFEQTLKMVDYTALSEANKQELKEVVRRFEKELTRADQDVSTLRELVESAKTYSVDVAAKLAMLALRDGIVDILDL